MKSLIAKAIKLETEPVALLYSETNRKKQPSLRPEL